jgi:Na+/H+ antiporter NhaD/arsenite permease-like protein
MSHMLIALIIFGITYLLIITEWVNKMIAALAGAFLLVWVNILGQEAAFRAVDWNVVFFLIGMMIVMGVLKETGIFQYMAIKIAKLAKAKPLPIMLWLFGITALISAVLDNVTTVMILVPIALLIANELKITPVPYIITMAIASNMGGTATLIGDPPNVIIGSATKYSFMEFIYHLTPVIVVIVIVSLALTWLLYRKSLKTSMENRARLMEYEENNLITNKKLLVFSLIVLTLMITAFILQKNLHLEISTIAITAGLIMLILHNRKKVEKVLMHDVDWATIFFFVGLFIIVQGLIETGVIKLVSQKIIQISGGNIKTTSVLVLWSSGILSAFVDNVPFVTTMIPLIRDVGGSLSAHAVYPLWWALSLGACLGGNGTLIGASANIVSAGIAHKNGHHLTFWDFTKIGAIYTLVSLLISTAYILIRYF